jgi:hypothetical protein
MLLIIQKKATCLKILWLLQLELVPKSCRFQCKHSEWPIRLKIWSTWLKLAWGWHYLKIKLIKLEFWIKKGIPSLKLWERWRKNWRQARLWNVKIFRFLMLNQKRDKELR